MSPNSKQRSAHGPATLGLLTALVCLLVPALGVATPFFAASGQCFEPMMAQNETTAASSFDEGEAISTSESTIDHTRCDDAGDLDDPSFNICFEGVEVPISTLPQLLAESQAEEVSAQILGNVDHAVRSLVPADLTEGDVSRETPARVRLEPLQTPRPRPTQNSCSVYPEECRSLPPLPPKLILEGSSPSADSSKWRPESKQLDDVDLQEPGSPPLRVGPSSGHDRRLERPPDLA